MDQPGIHEIFSSVAAKYGAHTALEKGGRVITYRELEDESNRLANFLISSGVSPGSIVAIMARDPVRVATAIIGILKARCIFAPFDPLMPENRLRAMAEQITPNWFVIESEHRGKVSSIVSERVNVICVDGVESEENGLQTVTVVRGYAQ